jgi:hypothetical protein
LAPASVLQSRFRRLRGVFITSGYRLLVMIHRGVTTIGEYIEESQLPDSEYTGESIKNTNNTTKVR